MRHLPLSIRSCTHRARRERHRAAPLRTTRRVRCRYLGTCRDGGSSPPPRTPEAPVHGGALLGLRRLEPLLGDLLLQRETLAAGFDLKPAATRRSPVSLASSRRISAQPPTANAVASTNSSRLFRTVVIRSPPSAG